MDDDVQSQQDGDTAISSPERDQQHGINGCIDHLHSHGVSDGACSHQLVPKCKRFTSAEGDCTKRHMAQSSRKSRPVLSRPVLIAPGLDERRPHHSTFSKSRLHRFRESKPVRQILRASSRPMPAPCQNAAALFAVVVRDLRLCAFFPCGQPTIFYCIELYVHI